MDINSGTGCLLGLGSYYSRLMGDALNVFYEHLATCSKCYARVRESSRHLLRNDARGFLDDTLGYFNDLNVLVMNQLLYDVCKSSGKSSGNTSVFVI